MEYKGVILKSGMILMGTEQVAPLKKGKSAPEPEAYKIIKIFEPKLIERQVFGGYDHTVELESGQRPEITGLERFWSKSPLLVSFDEFRFGTEAEKTAFAKIAKHYQMTHKDFDKWAKGRKLELFTDDYGQPLLDNRDIRAEYAEMRRKRTA